MITFPNCKINLGLNLLSKRNDGYHELQTVFYPLGFTDVLEIIQEDKDSKDEIIFSQSGLQIEISNENNLCIKAYHLLKKDFPDLPNIKMHLHKCIPAGAGLGGGSSNGAFTLKLLNQKFDLGLTTEKLMDHALQLGSDCPFFIFNYPCYATSRGEFMEPVALDLSDYKFLLVNPGIRISTAEAFSLITPTLPKRSIKDIIQQPIETWKEELKNDFEETIFLKYPELKKIKEKLYSSGTIFASMTGSGSTVYGIFKKDNEPQFKFPKNYFVKILTS